MGGKSVVKGGYQDRILRVDLSTEQIGTEALPSEDVLRKFIGGTGLGVYYLLREVTAAVEATDPTAPLIFMTGPLAGTAAPSSANWVTICLHLSIPYSAGVGHGHGFWAARLKHAGYEGIVVTGRASSPLYLWIDDDRVELRDASPYWGLGTRDTEQRIKDDLGDAGGISVACIGPGGEAVLPGGMIKVDRNHGAGKGSPGAVMGSKNLKAIAVRGTGRVPLAAPDAFSEVAAAWQTELLSRPAGSAAGNLYDGGMTRVYSNRGGIYRLAFKNWTDPEGGSALAENYVEAATRWKVTPRPSYNCPIGCSYDLQIKDGPYAGFTGSFCGGGEPFEGAAGMIGVKDAAETVLLTDHYDDMGLEVGTFGCIVSAAFEAYERGLITKDDTDGLELRWGDWEAAMQLIEKTIKREGIGAKLAMGLKAAAPLLSGSAAVADEFRKLTVHVKGAGINIHDWRQSESIIFGYIIAGSGPAHFGMGSDHRPIPEVGVAVAQKRVSGTVDDALGKVESVRLSAFAKMWWDSLGICWFAVQGLPDAMQNTVDAVRHATGWDDFTIAEAVEVGERIVSALRLVYERRGFTKSDEFDYGPRYTEPAALGPAHDMSIGSYVPAMIDEYYGQMGWDVATGFVLPGTVERLGLAVAAIGPNAPGAVSS